MYSYRTLVAWQHAHAIVLKTLRSIDEAYHPRSRALFEQLRRSVISVEANIVEGYALETNAYLLKHLRIAFGSAAESEILVLNASELRYLPPAVATEILALLDKCMKALRGLIRRYQREARSTTHHAPRTTYQGVCAQCRRASGSRPEHRPG
jgi:four helix bundle protein